MEGNLAQAGDNIVASSKLYGGTYTQFNDIPSNWLSVKFADAVDPENFRKAVDDKTRAFAERAHVQPRAGNCRRRGRVHLGARANLPLIISTTTTSSYQHEHGLHRSSLTSQWIAGRDGGARRWRRHRRRALPGLRRDAPAAHERLVLRAAGVGDLPEGLAHPAYKPARTVPLRHLGAPAGPITPGSSSRALRPSPPRSSSRSSSSGRTTSTSTTSMPGCAILA